MGILNDGPHIYAKVVHGLKAAKRKRNKKDENMEIEVERTDDLADTIDLLISKLNKKEWKTLQKTYNQNYVNWKSALAEQLKRLYITKDWS